MEVCDINKVPYQHNPLGQNGYKEMKENRKLIWITKPIFV
jgi:hypothetical protein